MNTRFLTTLAVAASIAAPAPSALAAATAHTYAVSIKGEQSSSWSYHGRTAGSCGGTTDGSGREAFTFRSSPTKLTAAHAAGRTWVLGGPLDLRASGSRTGSLIQSADGCGNPAEPMPTSGCKSTSWTIQAGLGHGLDHPYERVNLDSEGAGAFTDCPFFEGLADSRGLYTLPRGAGNLRSNELSDGLLLSWAALSSKQLARGKSFSVSKRTSRSYDAHDDWGRLTGQTELRWTLAFHAVR